MNEILLDMSEHELQCSKDGKKAECFCVEDNCMQRLLCFPCLSTHSDGNFRNISQLFTVNTSNYSLDPSMVKTFELWLSGMSRMFQERFGSMTLLLQQVMTMFDNLSSEKNLLEKFNSNESLFSNAKAELKEEYQKANFARVIKDGPQMTRLIEMHVEILKNLENSCPRKSVEMVKQKFYGIITAVEKLNDQCGDLVKCLGSVGLIADNNPECSISNQPDQPNDNDDNRSMQAEVLEEDPISISSKEPVESPKKVTLDHNKTISKDDLMVDEDQDMLQREQRIESIPVVQPLETNSENYGSYQNDEIQEFEESSHMMDSPIATSDHAKDIVEAAQPVENELIMPKNSSSKLALSNKNEILAQITDILNQNQLKPQLHDLLALKNAGAECGLNGTFYEYQLMVEMIEKGEQIHEKYEAIAKIYREESQSFKQTLIDKFLSMQAPDDPDIKPDEISLAKKNLKNLQRRIASHVKNKCKSKEEICSLISELKDSKVNFITEAESLQDAVEGSEMILVSLISELTDCAKGSHKISVTEFNKRFYEVLEFPLGSEALSKLIKQFISIMKFKKQLINIIQKSTNDEAKTSEEDDKSLTENAKKILRKMQSQKFTGIDFEAEGTRITEIVGSKKTRKSENLKENLPLEGQSEKKKKRTSEGKRKIKRESNAASKKEEFINNESSREERHKGNGNGDGSKSASRGSYWDPLKLNFYLRSQEKQDMEFEDIESVKSDDAGDDVDIEVEANKKKPIHPAGSDDVPGTKSIP